MGCSGVILNLYIHHEIVKTQLKLQVFIIILGSTVGERRHYY